jgi:hypothetical protein
MQHQLQQVRESITSKVTVAATGCFAIQPVASNLVNLAFMLPQKTFSCLEVMQYCDGTDAEFPLLI